MDAQMLPKMIDQNAIWFTGSHYVLVKIYVLFVMLMLIWSIISIFFLFGWRILLFPVWLFLAVSGRVRVAVRLRPRNAEELVADADFGDCVELQPEVWLPL
jgi:hypothetical protein